MNETAIDYAPMPLPKSRRLIADEGHGRALLTTIRLLLQSDVRKRIPIMRRMLRTHGRWLRAIAFVVQKPIAAEATPK